MPSGLSGLAWLLCQLVLPSADKSLQQAQTHYPQIPIEARKAWTEMAHRYLAGTLALLIFAIGFSALYKRYRGQQVPWHLPLFLMILVLLQAALGMWTVLETFTVVVMSHLLGGMLLVACLSRFGCN